MDIAISLITPYPQVKYDLPLTSVLISKILLDFDDEVSRTCMEHERPCSKSLLQLAQMKQEGHGNSCQHFFWEKGGGILGQRSSGDRYAQRMHSLLRQRGDGALSYGMGPASYRQLKHYVTI
jgi:hypothetical protein